MPSIIEGYNYDLFISYRQKDNKGDRWVSEFVEALKIELETTFKEDVSVYFDINPHDGLLETHDVDESLKEKLKCLVFIPIISRTYCDPRSFAWEHEFKAFVEQASQDQFGLKVKLSNGNVTSRVLPIRIHDLATEDVKIIEGITGNVLRSLDFIFKTASGVNRSLKSKEDHPGDNLNKTYYQDQINKVALSVKEIIHRLQEEPVPIVKDETQTRISFELTSSEQKRSRTKTTIFSTVGKPLVITGIAAFLIIAGILLYPKIIKRVKLEELRDPEGKISVAVIPFENITGDTTLNWFKKGISSLIINGLGNSSELAVCDDHTMFEVMEGMNLINTVGISPSRARDIARKAKAETYISGSFQGKEDTYWILANLVSSETGNILWTNKVEGNLNSSGYLDLADSLCNEIKNYLEIKALEDVADFDFREAYPKSAEAYRYFIEGMNLVLNQNLESGIKSLKKALEIDSTFTLASFFIAYANSYSYQMEQCIVWTNKTYLNKDRVPPKYQLWIEMWYACYHSKDIKVITMYCDQLAESGINTRFFWLDLGMTYFDFLHQYEKAVQAFEKVIEINPERIGDWKFLTFWEPFIIALHKTGNHEREREISEIGLQVLPDKSNWFYYRMAVCALAHGNTSEADDILVKYMAKHKELGTPENNLETFLGQMYEDAGVMDQAEIHYRKACELDSQFVNQLFFAMFLINNGVNVTEGMELIQKMLEKIPDDEYVLQLKGWGLYKQGKVEVALQLLEQIWEKSNGFNFDLYTHLEAAKKAVASQINY